MSNVLVFDLLALKQEIEVEVKKMRPWGSQNALRLHTWLAALIERGMKPIDGFLQALRDVFFARMDWRHIPME